MFQPEDETEDASRDLDMTRHIDVERIAELVYQLMLRDLAIERERSGWERAV